MDNHENNSPAGTQAYKSKRGGKIAEFVSSHVEKLQVSSFNLLLTVIVAIVLMVIVAFAVFSANLKGEEQVMVPNVVGLDLGDALLEMQQKELYQKVQFRYTDSDDAGKILSQSPEAGAIVKAGRRINIVVSKGMVLSKVENYVGENYDDVKIKLQTMFAGASRQLIVLSEPSYRTDAAPAGTVIAQNPPEGTSISTPVTLKLIVSKGDGYETVKVPNLVGLSVSKIYAQMEKNKMLFDFVSHVADSSKNEKIGVVTQQQSFDTPYVRTFTHCTVDFSVEELAADADKKAVTGIFSAKVTKYPFAATMVFEAEKDGKKKTLVTFKHLGGNVTIPYDIEHGTELSLSVNGKVVAKELVN